MSENPEAGTTFGVVSDADESVRAEGTIEWIAPPTAVNLTEIVALALTFRLPEVALDVIDICRCPPFFKGVPELKMR